MNEKFLKVEDIMETLGISKSAAYKLMRELNDEMVRRLRYRGWKNRRLYLKLRKRIHLILRMMIRKRV